MKNCERYSGYEGVNLKDEDAQDYDGKSYN